jgi:hypothetical protein
MKKLKTLTVMDFRRSNTVSTGQNSEKKGILGDIIGKTTLG